jgi:sialate O-acetylesterase
MKLKIKCRVSVVCVILIFIALPGYADVKLHQLIANGMVLQRDTKLKIWGWALPGERVTIAFNGKKAKTVTGADGKWLLELPALKACHC